MPQRAARRSRSSNRAMEPHPPSRGTRRHVAPTVTPHLPSRRQRADALQLVTEGASRQLDVVAHAVPASCARFANMTELGESPPPVLGELGDPAVTARDPHALLTGYLDWYRDRLLRKISGLSDAQLTTPVEPLGWSPLGLVKHLSMVERRWMRWGFAAEDVLAHLPGGDAAEWDATSEPTAALLSAHHEEVERSRALAAQAELDDGHAGDRARDELATDDHWAAPEHIFVEVVSVARGRLLSRKIALERAEDAATALGEMAIETVSSARLVPRTWELRGSVTAYDAAYVAAAETLECPLLTGDLRLARAGGVRCEIRPISGE
ncbi:mycothiol transferase [Bounagaea algeriensis]